MQSEALMHDRRAFLRSTVAGVLAAAIGGLSLSDKLRADQSKAKPKLSALFFGGELKEVRAELEKRFDLTAYTGGMVKGSKAVKGLEQLEKCDLWIGSIDKRTEPSAEQLGHFKEFHARGGAFAGYRAASHVFQNYLEADQAVWGAKYGGHHLLEKDPVLVIGLVESAGEHAILRGLQPPRPVSGSYVYTEVVDDVKLLLRSGLEGDMMPHTWTRENAKTKGRAFYTRYDAKEMAANETCREIFLRGVAWAVKKG